MDEVARCVRYYKTNEIVKKFGKLESRERERRGRARERERERGRVCVKKEKKEEKADRQQQPSFVYSSRAFVLVAIVYPSNSKWGALSLAHSFYIDLNVNGVAFRRKYGTLVWSVLSALYSN